MKVIKFGNYEFSTYILIIGVAFLIAFIIFLKLLKRRTPKIDIYYIYLLNIIGFAIGAKLLSLISNQSEFNLYNFINSGYSYLGGIIGSVIFIILYCFKYKLNLKDILSAFSVVYPLIYAVSKIGCFLNECCFGIIKINNNTYYFPLQLIGTVIMLILFFILFFQYQRNKKDIISKFLIGFSIIRFSEDFYRYYRNVILYNLTLEQIICLIFVLIGLSVIIKDIKILIRKNR